MYLGRHSEGEGKFPARRVPFRDLDPGAAAGGMGLRRERSASGPGGTAGPAPGRPAAPAAAAVPRRLRAAAPGEAEAPSLSVEDW